MNARHTGSGANGSAVNGLNDKLPFHARSTEREAVVQFNADGY